MEFIKIINSNIPIKPGYHFTFQEFFDPILASEKKEYDIPECLVDGVNYLRDYFKLPMYITSTLRSKDPMTSLHQTGRAVDLGMVDEKIRIEYINNFAEEMHNYKHSPLFFALRARGVNGFGIEIGNCIHIDYRPDSRCNSKDDYGKFCIFSWDKVNGSIVVSDYNI